MVFRQRAVAVRALVDHVYEVLMDLIEDFDDKSFRFPFFDAVFRVEFNLDFFIALGGDIFKLY